MSVLSPVIKTLADLVAIPSVNPNYEGGTGESQIANWIEQFFQRQQIHVEQQSVLPGRSNVIAKIPGRTSNHRIILEAHMDTVSTKGMSIAPWDPVIKNGNLYGRGACDTKGGLAAMMHAMLELAKSETHPDAEVWFAATIDEEYSYRGVQHLCAQNLKADAAIVAEPTQLQTIIASKGLVRWMIEVEGVAAHSAKPHLGKNAIVHMMHLIHELERDTQNLALSSHPLLGSATLNIGVIRGGVQINLVPDRCEIEIDRRLLPDEDLEQVLNHYQSMVEKVAYELPDFKATMHPPMLTDLPLDTNPNSHAVKVMKQTLIQHGQSDDLAGVPFCSDASKFGAMQIPSIIFGPGSIDRAHSANEYVECDQVEMAATLYRDFVLNF